MRKTIFLILIILLIGSIVVNLYQWQRPILCENSSPIDTIVIFDTIPYIAPQPKDSDVVGYVTERLPIVDGKEDNFPTKSISEFPESEQKFPESGEILQDSVGYFSKSIPDSADVVIPITQKVYEDSTYKAFVSGYKASLDSFYIYPQTKIITIREKPKRWHIGITIGYGITPKGFQPYLGLGCTYTFISF